MDYQFLCAIQFVLLLLAAASNTVEGIVGRDLVLTPKQGLQLNGKSLYYKDDANTSTHNQSTVRPWERTLKHVTYVTLFTNAATDAAAGNISKLQAYTDFLHAPYIQQHNENDVRFGDIVTLANGRLEQIRTNNSFRFVEGACNFGCDAQSVVALWQVQKIRHRDANRKFRYEMKFSVSPLQMEAAGGSVKRTAITHNEHSYNNSNINNDNVNSKRNSFQTFIQRDDDYPQTFGKIIYADQTGFADRRLDEYMGRNFRQAPLNDYRQVTPMPQSTFMHSIFQPHPHYPPMPEKLNIGEYIKDFAAKATPKIELFPNVLNPVSRSHYPTPTTYRPNYQIHKFPRPELYQPPPPPRPVTQHELIKYAPQTQEHLPGTAASKITTPVVTHHFHHHFYMPSTTSIENSFDSAEQPLRNPSTSAYKTDVNETPRPYYNKFYNDASAATRFSHDDALQPQSSLVQFPSNTETEVHQERVVKVTPVPPLKKPQLYHMYPIGVSARVPLLIYPAPVVEEEQLPERSKPFIQSEPIDVEPIRYSEPDPLYLNLAHNPPTTDAHQFELNAPQMEAPKVTQYAHYEDAPYDVLAHSKTAKPDSIAAQLPPPDKDQDVHIPYVDETQGANSENKHDLEQTSSQKEVQISTEKSTTNTMTQTEVEVSVTRATVATTTAASITTTTAMSTTTPPPPMTTTSAPQSQLETIKASATSVRTTITPTTNTLHSATTAASTTLPMDSSTHGRYNKNSFISTSTSETPLRAVSRYRAKYTRASTTSEAPVLKWKPRRKHVFSSQNNVEDKTKFNTKPEAQFPQTNRSNDTALPAAENEVFEVLTQKSVSKSVSIKVGNNGEEIPIIIDDNDDNENEVKTGE